MSNDLQKQAFDLLEKSKQIASGNKKVASDGLKMVNSILNTPEIRNEAKNNPELAKNLDKVKEEIRKIKNLKG